MSVNSIDTIMQRIEVATEKSPIAVFVTGIVNDSTGERELDAVFADTVKSQVRISRGDHALVGVFHTEMSTNDVWRKLKLAQQREF